MTDYSFRIAGLAMAVTMTVGSAAVAQVTTDQSAALPDTVVVIDPILQRMTLADLIGRDVYGADGENIGEIENLVANGGRIFAVFDADETFDSTSRDFVIPIEQFRVVGDRLTLPFTEGQVDALRDYTQETYQALNQSGTVGDALAR